MVLSSDVRRAAYEGDLEKITAWMSSNDVNDTVVELRPEETAAPYLGRYRSTLLKLILRRATKQRTMDILDKQRGSKAVFWRPERPGARRGVVSMLPLARAVIARGADVDVSNGGCNSQDSGLAPLHLAAQCRGYEAAAMCSLLIEAGADVNKTTQARGARVGLVFTRGPLPARVTRVLRPVCEVPHVPRTPLGVALDSLKVTQQDVRDQEGWPLESSPRKLLAVTREVVTVLLRAGARVDAVKGQESAVAVLDDNILRKNTYYKVPVWSDVNVCEIDAMLLGVRDAGSWRGFLNTRYYVPLVRLRGLANRGHATTEDPTLSSMFRLPPRPFRVVLTFCWN